MAKPMAIGNGNGNWQLAMAISCICSDVPSREPPRYEMLLRVESQSH